MGYGYYVLPDGREAGYMVDDVCNRDGCDTAIDRGLSYLCGTTPGHSPEDGCGDYFCGEHQYDHDCPQSQDHETEVVKVGAGQAWCWIARCACGWQAHGSSKRKARMQSLADTHELWVPKTAKEGMSGMTLTEFLTARLDEQEDVSEQMSVEVAAKRGIVAEHGARTTEYLDAPPEQSCRRCGKADEYPVPYPCQTLRLLASVWADHEDYGSAWAPERETP